MKKTLIFSFITFTTLLLWVRCGSPSNKENFISEGTITYNAEVVDSESPMAMLAPSKMTFKFKNNKSAVEMSAGMGMLTTSFISDPETKIFTQLIKLIGEKYSVIQNAAEIKKENELFNLEVIPTKETKIIAGYNCKKVNVHYKGEESSDSYAYYTTDLNVQNPNFASPFYMLDGVLMEFQIKKFGLEMKFTATSVVEEDVDNSTFGLPDDYKQISLEEMTNKLAEFQ